MSKRCASRGHFSDVARCACNGRVIPGHRTLPDSSFEVERPAQKLRLGLRTRPHRWGEIMPRSDAKPIVCVSAVAADPARTVWRNRRTGRYGLVEGARIPGYAFPLNSWRNKESGQVCPAGSVPTIIVVGGSIRPQWLAAVSVEDEHQYSKTASRSSVGNPGVW